jgi:L-ascorbate metabolism protein UlaG (beta-lactamase superfamily)
MEITWFGDTCIRAKGREGVIAADAYRTVVGPTGRGLTADICTYSHADTSEAPRTGSRSRKRSTDGAGLVRPTSLEPAFLVDSPGEYEVHEILITGVRTFRDEQKGAERGFNTAFVYELDGLHAVHLGDIGHLLNEDMLAEIGHVDVICVPIGGSLGGAKAAELISQLDANLIVPMPMGADDGTASPELERFLREMSVQDPTPVSKISVSISTVPQETTVVMLEPRSRV